MVLLYYIILARSLFLCPLVRGQRTPDPVSLLAALLAERVKLQRLITALKQSWMSLAN